MPKQQACRRLLPRNNQTVQSHPDCPHWVKHCRFRQATARSALRTIPAVPEDRPLSPFLAKSGHSSGLAEAGAPE